MATDEPKPLIAPAPTRDAAQPAAVAPLPDPRQELEQAARRLRAGDADARAAGRAMLQRLRREHFGSALAEQAWDLLLADRQAEQHQEPAPGPNAEITRLTAKVATLTSLAAAALADVLSDLFHPSVPAAPADAEAVQALRRDALQRVERLLAGADDEAGPVAPELCAIIEATVHRHRDFAGALRPALDARELAVGEHRLAQAEASIAAALAQADPDAAAAAFLALRHLPEPLHARRNALAEGVLAVRQRIDAAGAALARIAACIADPRPDWPQVAAALADADALAALAREPLPTDLRVQIAAQAGKLEAAVGVLIERRARECRTLDDARELQRGIEQLPAQWHTRVQEDWLIEPLTALRQELAIGLASAASPQAVLGLRPTNAFGLPAPLAQALGTLNVEIEQLVAAWQELSSATPSHASAEAAPSLPALPSAFLSAQQGLRALAAELEAARAGLRRAPDEATLTDLARRLAEQSSAWPNHAGLKQLRGAVADGLLLARIEQALSKWSLTDMLALLDTPEARASADATVRALAPLRAHRKALIALAELARRPVLADGGEALAWWQRWREQSATLPAGLPAVLGERLAAQRSARAAQWLALLPRANDGAAATPDAMDAAADLIVDAALDRHPELFVAEARLRRQALALRIEQDIAAGDRAAATAKLARLAERGGERALLERFQLRLDLAGLMEQPLTDQVKLWRERLPELIDILGKAAMVPALSAQFDRLAAAAGPAGPSADPAAVQGLAATLSQAVRPALDAMPAQGAAGAALRARADWPDIETALATGFDPAAVRNLVRWWSAADAAVRRAVQPAVARLIAAWQPLSDTERSQRLAWAAVWIAGCCPEQHAALLGEGAEPVAAWTRRLDQRLEDVKALLADPAKLAGVRAAVDAAEREWHALDACLRELPAAQPDAGAPQSQRPRQLDLLRQWLEALDRLTAETAALEQADFRAPETAWRLRRAKTGVVELRTSGVASADALERRLDRLRGLVELAELYPGFAAAAAALTRSDTLSLVGVYGTLADRLAAMHRLLEAAGGAAEQARLLAADCREQLLAAGEPAAAMAEGAGLPALIESLHAGAAEEQRVGDNISTLEGLRPLRPMTSVDGVDYAAFVAALPVALPERGRLRALYVRFVTDNGMREVLRPAVGRLPGWIAEVLAEGAGG